MNVYANFFVPNELYFMLNDLSAIIVFELQNKESYRVTNKIV